MIGLHNNQIEGINSRPDQINALLQAGIDYTQPPVRHQPQYIDCINSQNNPDRILILDVEASEQIHRNQRGECFLRVGDENRLLSQREERELIYDKGEATFDNSIVPDIRLDDLDMTAIQHYAEAVKSLDIMGLLRARGLFYDPSSLKQGVTYAALLMFGKTSPIYSYIRYLRYSGTQAETGVRSNVQEDIRLEGTIPELIKQARDLLAQRLQVRRLALSGQFINTSVLPEFAWLEAIVNAVTHRSYSLQGDGVRILDFADRLEVHSPGRLPGLVRVPKYSYYSFLSQSSYCSCFGGKHRVCSRVK